MEAIWYLLIFAPFIALPILWWNYRNKVSHRESDSGARWERFSGNVNPVDPHGAGTVAAVGSSTTDVTASTAASPQYARRQRTLDPVETVVFYLLKNALPDHEVMPQIALAKLLEVPAGIGDAERDQRQRALAQHVVAFAICSKTMQLVVLIDLVEQAATSAQTATSEFKIRCLAQAGIRYLRLERTKLPKREAVRALILGE